MKVVIQRCLKGKVSVNNKTINEINKGFVILLGINKEDTIKDVDYLVNKIIKLRIFDDENGIMNKSILDIKGEILSISQFTLEATTKDGARPSYTNAMSGKEAIEFYNLFNKKLNEHIPTYEGAFGQEMIIDISNDGPVTIIIDTKNK